MAQAIAQVEAELELALASLDGWVEDVLAHETDRFHELSTAWRAPSGPDSRDGPLARPRRRGPPGESPDRRPTTDAARASSPGGRTSTGSARCGAGPMRT